MQQKRIKSGLAVTEHHLHLVDDNLSKAKVKSRNDFVEKAIEYYAGCLNAEQNREYMGGLLSADLEKLFSKFAKTFSTNQYKLTVQVAVLSYLVGRQFRYDPQQMKQLKEICAQDVRRLDSVPDFGRIMEQADLDRQAQDEQDW